MVVVIVGAAAALLFGLVEERPVAGRAVAMGGAAILIVAGVGALLFPPAIMEQRLSPYKTLSILSLALDARHTLTVEDATARVDVVESGTIHVMPGLSLLAPATLPIQAGVDVGWGQLDAYHEVRPGLRTGPGAGQLTGRKG